MSTVEFSDVKFIAKANIYHDGKVISHAFFLPDGSRKTAGVIFPGEYEFGTGDREVMEVTAGALAVLLPGHDEWETFPAGTSFGIPSGSSFKCRSGEVSEYVCSYFK